MLDIDSRLALNFHQIEDVYIFLQKKQINK